MRAYIVHNTGSAKVMLKPSRPSYNIIHLGRGEQYLFKDESEYVTFLPNVKRLEAIGLVKTEAIDVKDKVEEFEAPKAEFISDNYEELTKAPTIEVNTVHSEDEAGNETDEAVPTKPPKKVAKKTSKKVTKKTEEVDKKELKQKLFDLQKSFKEAEDEEEKKKLKQEILNLRKLLK